MTNNIKKTRMLKYVNDWIESRIDLEALKNLMIIETESLKRQQKELSELMPKLKEQIQGQPSNLEYLPGKYVYGSDKNLHELALLLEVYVPRAIRTGRKKP